MVENIQRLDLIHLAWTLAHLRYHIKYIGLWFNLSEVHKTTFSRQAVTRSNLPFCIGKPAAIPIQYGHQ